MNFLRPFLIVALTVTAPIAMAQTRGDQKPDLVSAEACDGLGVFQQARCPAVETRVAAVQAPRADDRSVGKLRKITKMPWMIGAYQ